MSPVKQRAKAILDKLNGVNSPIVAELGVFVGALSRELLSQRNDLHLIMVDVWGGNTSEDYKATNDFHATATKEQQDGWEKQARELEKEFAGRVEVIKDFTTEAAKRIDDGSLDLVFIDADHSYKGCKEDIAAWESKVKVGGWISGHDYENNSQDFKFGVTPAVDEYIAATGKELFTGLNYTWFARC